MSKTSVRGANLAVSKKTSIAEQDEFVLKLLAASAFLIFFSAYIMAPLIPTLAQEFHATQYQIGWIVPAYLLPYGVCSVLYGPLSDRWGRRKMLLILVAISGLTNLLCAMAWSAPSLIVMRFLAGVGSGGVVTVGLALVGDMFPYEKLGRPLGWMFGAIAGGMAFGSTLGAWLNPYLGWRNEFLLLGLATAVVVGLLMRHRRSIRDARSTSTWRELLAGYRVLLSNARGVRTFAYIFANGVFHGGIFAWLGAYLFHRYQLRDIAIGKALLGYGVPGMLLGPVVGRLADRFGRRRLIPFGFLLAAFCALALVPHFALWAVTVLITVLSVGFDMSHPLMAGIVASLDARRRGQAIGLNACAIFIGFGVGAILFQSFVLKSFDFAFLIFGSAQVLLGVAALWNFAGEKVPAPAKFANR